MAMCRTILIMSVQLDSYCDTKIFDLLRDAHTGRLRCHITWYIGVYGLVIPWESSRSNKTIMHSFKYIYNNHADPSLID